MRRASTGPHYEGVRLNKGASPLTCYGSLVQENHLKDTGHIDNRKLKLRALEPPELKNV